MISGTISGHLIEKVKVTPSEDAPFCAFMVIEVRTFVAGREVQQAVECYFPKWMAKRIEYYFNNDIKRITMAYDHISVGKRTNEAGRNVLVINVSQVF